MADYNPFILKRIGTIMKPEKENPLEIEGVLNPAAARGPDGNLYLFPRLVAKGNYSRIGIAKVIFNNAGDPVDVERLGIVLEPEADYEKNGLGGGGCEDPRITYFEPLKVYVMTDNNNDPLLMKDRESQLHLERNNDPDYYGPNTFHYLINYLPILQAAAQNSVPMR